MDSNQPARKSFIAKHITQSEGVSDLGTGSDQSRHSSSLSSVVARVQSKSWTNRDDKEYSSSHHSSNENRRDHHHHHHHSQRHHSSHHAKASHNNQVSSSSSSNHGRSSSPRPTESKYSSRHSKDRSRSRSGSRSRDRDKYRPTSDEYYKSQRSNSRDRSEGSSRTHSRSDRNHHNESRSKSRYDLDDESSSYHQSSSSHQQHYSSRGSRSQSSAINDDSHYNNYEMEEGEIDQDDDTSNSANESSYSSSYYNSRDNSSRDPQKNDWTCYKCGVNNFKRRNQCFKCCTDREESEANDTGDEISHTPTNCLILRNLTLSITGDQILSFIGSLTNVPIKSIRLPRDPLYNSPRGVCYLELHTTLEATKLMSLISSIDTSTLTDGLPSTPLMVSYVRRSSSSSVTPSTATYAASLALAAAQWTNQQQNVSTESLKSLGTVNINGCVYQKYPTPDPSKFVLEEKSGFHYDHTTRLYYDSKSKYYYNSLTQQYLLWSPQYATYLPVDSKTGSTTIGPSISAPALTSTASVTVDTNESADVSSNHHTLSTNQQNNSTTCSTIKSDATGNTDKKVEKVITAKSIVKQMEKWAKTLNQRSSAASASIKPMVPSFMKDLKAAQAAAAAAAAAENADETLPVSSESRVSSFKMSLTSTGSSSSSVLTSTVNNSLSTGQSLSIISCNGAEKLDTKAIASILDDGDSDNDEPFDPMTVLREEESKFLDFTKLLCRLCKRQFNSREQLTKHQTVSELHSNNLKSHLKGILTDHQFKELEKKQNLDKLIHSSCTPSYPAIGTGKSNSNFEYLDRAKERRRKWGIDIESEPNRIKEKYLDEMAAENAKAAAIASTQHVKPIDSSNRGSKMMKAMGWKEGQGLGKKGTGRTDIIHVEVRPENSGLGMKKAKTTQLVPGESYKDAVKRAMAQRYKELTEQEQE